MTFIAQGDALEGRKPVAFTFGFGVLLSRDPDKALSYRGGVMDARGESPLERLSTRTCNYYGNLGDVRRRDCSRHVVLSLEGGLSDVPSYLGDSTSRENRVRRSLQTVKKRNALSLSCLAE